MVTEKVRKKEPKSKIESPNGSSLTREIGFFFLKFIVASFLLYLLFELFGVGRAYAKLVGYIAKPFLAIFHYTLIMEKVIAITEDISLNPIVFVSLVIATAGLNWKEKLKALALGLVILTAANALTLFMIFLSYFKRSETLWAQSEFLNLTINFFFPILLWFALIPSNLRRVFKRN